MKINTTKKTCFVISPIGDKGSEVRSKADALFDLIIEPALEKYDFEITRADKNTAVSSITSEIVQLVQDSGLCIIDITGHNPNVMYECGRRHETAKPFIMVAAEGEKLPFDINTIRTIFYNLNDAREIRNTVRTIQAIIEKMLESGLEPERSGESLSSLSNTLTRIERKIDRMSAVGATVNAPTSSGTGSYQEILSSLGLNDAFEFALSQRDIGLAEYLMSNLERQLPHEKYVDFVLTQVAPMGSILAHQKLEEGFGNINTYDRKLQMDYIGSLVVGYNVQDREAEGLELMGEFFNRIMETESPSPELSNSDKAYFLNQYSRLLHGLKRYDDALKIEKEVIRLAPDDMSYNYNLSTLYNAVEDLDSAYKTAKKLYALMTEKNEYDVDHLSLVVESFAQQKDPKIQEVFSKLQEIGPYKATMLLRNKEIKKALQGLQLNN